MVSSEQKLLVPYIERFNGNLCVQVKDYERAIAHYNKSMLGLKMLFQMEKDPVITSDEQAIKLIEDIQTIVSSNISLCYLKLDMPHEAIRYAKQALEKNPDYLKAIYRMCLAYINIGEFDKARENLDSLKLKSKNDQDML